MNDIFMSYASADRAKAALLARVLEQRGWSVWWDRTIPAGKAFDEVIDEALTDSRCVVVLWSRAATRSNWVKEEAEDGRGRRVLVPALIEDVKPPRGFRRIQAANLIAWDGDTSSIYFDRFVADISGVLGPSPFQVEEQECRLVEKDATSATKELRMETEQLADEERRRQAAEESERRSEREAKRVQTKAERHKHVDRIRLTEQSAMRKVYASEGAKSKSSQSGVSNNNATSRRGRLFGVATAMIVFVVGTIGISFVYRQQREPEQLAQQLDQTRAEAVSESAVRETGESESQKRTEVENTPYTDAVRRQQELTAETKRQVMAERDAQTQGKAAEHLLRAEAEGKNKVSADQSTMNSESPEMVVIRFGAFEMGSSKNDPDAYHNEFPQHKVVFRKPFAIGKYEVTFDEYDLFAKATGRRRPGDLGWGRGTRPVIDVSWDDAMAYARWLSKQTGARYRLPSESEWEYIARARTTSNYWMGDDIGRNQANCKGCGSKWDSRQTAPVGSFNANKFGLYDTAGNVWEWVQDCWHDGYYGVPADGSARKEPKCAQRVIRGGSWTNFPRYTRSAHRSWYFQDYRNYYIGFRLARDL